MLVEVVPQKRRESRVAQRKFFQAFPDCLRVYRRFDSGRDYLVASYFQQVRDIFCGHGKGGDG